METMGEGESAYFVLASSRPHISRRITAGTSTTLTELRQSQCERIGKQCLLALLRIEHCYKFVNARYIECRFSSMGF